MLAQGFLGRGFRLCLARLGDRLWWLACVGTMHTGVYLQVVRPCF